MTTLQFPDTLDAAQARIGPLAGREQDRRMRVGIYSQEEPMAEPQPVPSDRS